MEDNRARIEILWDGDDLELKTIGAIIEVFSRAQSEGLDRVSRERVAGYFAARISAAPLPTPPNTTT